MELSSVRLMMAESGKSGEWKEKKLRIPETGFVEFVVDRAREDLGRRSRKVMVIRMKVRATMRRTGRMISAVLPRRLDGREYT